jgi:hypothetical protein
MCVPDDTQLDHEDANLFSALVANRARDTNLQLGISAALVMDRGNDRIASLVLIRLLLFSRLNA